MDSLVGYGSDDEVENERYGSHHSAVDHGGAPGGSRRRDDDTNYDDVNMDMSEERHVLPQDSQAESEPELPQAEPAPPRHSYRDDRKGSVDSRDRNSRDNDRSSRDLDRSSRDLDRSSRDLDRSSRDLDRSSRDGSSRDRDSRARRDSPAPRDRGSDRREPRRDDRYRSERGRGPEGAARRGLLGDRPDDKHTEAKVPALMDLKPFGGELPPGLDQRKSQDARDAVSPRFADRDRRDKDRERDRDRDTRHSRHSEERRHKHPERRERSRSRGASGYAAPSSHSSSSSSERRPSPPSEYRPSSYKVNKKLEVMEKMGLQIKTPSGSMATAQQLRAAASEPSPSPSGGLPSYYNPSAINSNKILDQVNKRKLLWSNKAKNEQEEAAKWSGTRFAQDNDGKQVSKFMRLMGIKDPAAVKPEPDKQVDPIKKQEELFQAMQAQYEVARATTHTMRGVGLGFQRGQF